jgi:hypothetical protein
MKELLTLIFWIAGIVLAKGFWSTFFAVIIPFYSWYIVIEHMMGSEIMSKQSIRLCLRN